MKAEVKRGKVKVKRIEAEVENEKRGDKESESGL